MAALPVMEGKALLFKQFAGVDAFPICLDTRDVESIVRTCQYIAPTFGGINLEDITAPRCIEIEERLKDSLDIPVFHDDQHGTAIVVLAALQNAIKVVGRQLEDLRVTINGAGAAGTAIAKLLLHVGVAQIVVCDRAGAIYRGRSADMDAAKQWLAENTNPHNATGMLRDAVSGADVFVGVSAANVLTPSDIKRMAKDPIVFALANPDPEIAPEDALPHVAVMATGRSDYPNQINNVLCFPGFFRGMLDVRARCVTEDMKIAAANAIAGVIQDRELRPDYVIPSVFNVRVAKAVASAAADSARREGVARREAKSGNVGNQPKSHGV
jgi:malate dehydrogenase (oxaloacetate-decarboxylating)